MITKKATPLWGLLFLLASVLLTACGTAPDAAVGSDVAVGPLPEAELNAAEGSDIGKVQEALSLLQTIRLRPVADITPKEWVERPSGTPHWQILNNAWFTGGDDVSCAWSGRDVETNSLREWTDLTQLDSSFIKKGVALTGGTFWVCARQYTFVDPTATLQTILRWRRNGAVIKTSVLTPNLAVMQSSGPNNPGADFQPRWYAFTIPTFGTFIDGDTIEGGLRTSAVGGGRVQGFKYLVDANVSIPVSVKLP